MFSECQINLYICDNKVEHQKFTINFANAMESLIIYQIKGLKESIASWEFAADEIE